MLASLLLTGCPQWLDDEFRVIPAGQASSRGSGGDDGEGGGGSTGGAGASNALGGVGGDAQGGRGGAGGAASAPTAGTGGDVAMAGEGGAGGDGAGGAAVGAGSAGEGGSSGAEGGSGGSPGGGAGAGGSTTTPDAGPPPGPDLSVLRDAIVHRYQFEQAGTVVVDSVGTADGTFIGGTLDGTSGAASLSGNGQYVELPPGLISGHAAVTLEAWVVWTPYSALSGWERIFDFGENDGAFGEQGDTAGSYLFLTPSTGGPSGTTHLAFRGAVVGVTTLNATDAAEADTTLHMAAVVDGPSNEMAIYSNGVLIASRTLTSELSSIDDVNNWLGHSQYADDDDFRGEILEFRIYDEALDATAVDLSFTAGPDAAL